MESHSSSPDETGNIAEDWDCTTYDRCVVKYNVNMTISDAREACHSHDGVLPRPYSMEENQKLAEIGSTWIEMYVNEKISKFNFDHYALFIFDQNFFVDENYDF